MSLLKSLPKCSPNNYSSKLIHSWYREIHKVVLKFALLCNFQNSARVNNRPIKFKKFAQAGHPGASLTFMLGPFRSLCQENSYINVKLAKKKVTESVLAFLRFLQNHCLPFCWGRCYDHNFPRFLPIFVEKFGVFLKNQCYDQIFA
jgi:hypothetical protein